MRGFLPANLFFKRCLVLKLFDAYQLRKEICPCWPQSENFTGGCFLRHLAAYHLKGFLQVAFQQKVIVTSTTSKILLAGGFTKRGVNFRISEGVLLWTAESRFSTGGDSHKHHLKNISVGGFTLGGLNVRIYRRTFPSAIKYSEISWVGFTNRPSKVGISEGTFQRS